MPLSTIRARDIMNDDPPYCLPDTPLNEIARRFAEEGLSGLLVVDEDKRLRGVITETDLVDQQRNLHLPTALAIFDMVIPIGEARFERELERLQAMKAEDLVQPDVKTVDADADLGEIATIMSEHGVHHLPVMENGQVVGLISKHDVIRALARR
ncbi:MAG: CBS domain-containing protein [Zetaproteobacteria bacterium]|nr:MAG: CBS domain-containing protein [Zetaproteobacteria bacterium]